MVKNSKTSWYQARDRLEDQERFRNVNLSDARKRALFDEHIQRLEEFQAQEFI